MNETSRGTFAPDADAWDGSPAARAQVRGSTMLLVGQAFAVIVNLVTQVVLVRYLSTTSYGIFAFALSIVQVGETVAAFGLRRGVNRFLPIYEEEGDTPRAAGVLLFAVGTVAGLGLAVVAVVIGLRGVLAGTVAEAGDARVVLAILILLAPIHAFETLFDGTFGVLGRPGLIAARRHVFTPASRLAAVLLLAFSGSGMTLLAVTWVILGGVGLIVYGALLVSALRVRGLLSPIRARQLSFPIRRTLRFTVPLLTWDVSGVLVSSGGAILVGVIAGAVEVASLRAVMPISLTMTYVISNFELLFVPTAARLLARRDAHSLDRLYWGTAAWTTVLSLPMFVIAFVFADPLTILLFGERYADSGDVLAALAVGHFVLAATGMNGLLLSVYGEVRYLAWVHLVAAVVSILLNVALIPIAGALGAAIALSITLILLNAAFQVGLARRTDVRGIDPHYVRLFGAIAAAIAALVALELAVSPPFAVDACATAAVCLAILVFARRELALHETFPELASLPGLRRLLTTPDRRR